MIIKIKVVFAKRQEIKLQVLNGRLLAVSPQIQNETYIVNADTPLCFEAEENGNRGCRQTYAELRFPNGGCSFKLCDVRADYPVFSTKLGLAATVAEDTRRYEEIRRDIRLRGLSACVSRTEGAEEPSSASAAGITRHSCPTFLCVPGTVDLFEAGYRGYPIEEKQHMELYDYIIPRKNWDRLDYPEAGIERMVYRYLAGRGMGCRTDLKRRLERGYLPVLNARLRDGCMEYRMQYFADRLAGNIEDAPGTNYLEADYHSAAHVLTAEQEERLRGLQVPGAEGETVLRMKAVLRNRGKTPAYAFFRLPHINTSVMAEGSAVKQEYDGNTGYGTCCGRVYMLAETDTGAPCEGLETAYLLAPGECKTLYVLLFHGLVKAETAKGCTPQDYELRKRQAAAYWEERLENLRQFRIPDKRIERAVKAGYLQLAASCYGEPGGTVAPCVGVYSPIATESGAVAHVLESFGNSGFAGRCIDYFFAKQRPDGFIQNMIRYMPETGAALCLAGVHYAYSGDLGWVKEHRQGILLASEYLCRWIEANSRSDSCPGFGMIDGQVADPQDTFRSYELNAIAWGGLYAAGKLLALCNDCNAPRFAQAAETLKANIVTAYGESLVRGMLVPLQNGEWVPLPAPWAEGQTACCLHLEGETVTTHASAVLKDSLLSVPYLALYGILDPNGSDAEDIVNAQCELFSEKNTGFSQPYCNVVPYLNLLRGEKNSFLQEYYAGLAAMADPETFSFWEHCFLATPHKTHEQAEFMLRTRAMLYYETPRSRLLTLFRGVPRAWYGGTFCLQHAGTLFGRFSLRFTCGDGVASLSLRCRWNSGEPVKLAIYPPLLPPYTVEGGAVENGVYFVSAPCGDSEILFRTE